MAKFEAERDELIKVHEEKKMRLKKEYTEKELELEKELDAALTGLMEKHKPDTFEASSSVKGLQRLPQVLISLEEQSRR